MNVKTKMFLVTFIALHDQACCNKMFLAASCLCRNENIHNTTCCSQSRVTWWWDLKSHIMSCI